MVLIAPMSPIPWRTAPGSVHPDLRKQTSVFNPSHEVNDVFDVKWQLLIFVVLCGFAVCKFRQIVIPLKSVVMGDIRFASSDSEIRNESMRPGKPPFGLFLPTDDTNPEKVIEPTAVDPHGDDLAPLQ